MPSKIIYLDKITALVNALEENGFQPVLVGGVALVILGSQRVTKDFDFLISPQDLASGALVEIFYKHGFELVKKFNKEGEVVRTVDNPRVACIKLRADLPQSLFFFDWKVRLKVDLLLDFPLSAQEIASRALKIKIGPSFLRIASEPDLLRLKEIAYSDRHSARDAEDLEFLKSRRKTAKKKS